MNLVIRQAIASEISELVQLWQKIDAYPQVERPFGGDSLDKPAYAQNLLEHTLKLENASVLVATANGNIIGTISGHVFDKPAVNLTKVGVIYSLWVNQENRDQGVGQALLTYLENRFKEQGAQALQVGWDIANDTAAQWWQKRGYLPYEVIASKVM